MRQLPLLDSGPLHVLRREAGGGGDQAEVPVLEREGGGEVRTAAPAMTEEQFLQQILQLARLLGWHTAHFRAAKTSRGWRTAVSGDGKGFPDLVLTRDRTIYAELKAARGKLSPEQEEWRDRLLLAGCEWYLWQPSQFEEIASILGANVGGRGE